jgi:DNA-directed RNA polymerase subunit alpha
MHIIQEEIGLPIFSSQNGSTGDDSHKVFSIAPLPPGYGMTLGNALRRALLGSLPGAAASSVRIQGVQHEYTAIKGVTESVVDIMLNLKQVRFRKHAKDSEVITLDVKGPKDVTAADLKVSSDIEVLNPDLHLFTVEKGGSVTMEITVDKGVGYIPASENNKKRHEPGLMYIDAVYSPVERVRFDVEPTRVGQRTNLEKLVLEVKTTGSLTADEAVRFASQLLQSYFGYFGSDQKPVEPEFMADFSRAAVQPMEDVGSASSGAPVKESYTPIEILNLSPRTLNALINAGVGSIEQLTKCTESILSNFRGFGAKALDEVKATLATRGLTLSDESEE